MFINYAHRGASKYYPQNTLSSFYASLDMGANGIETDVRKTKDGVLVLFHDKLLEKATDFSGKISDYTYNELTDAQVFSKDRTKSDRIVTFEEFLKFFGFRNLSFAIELKDNFIEKETVDLLKQYDAVEKTVITSFDFENLIRVKEYAPEFKIGYLYDDDVDAVSKVLSVHGEQVCPKADMISPEFIGEMHKNGLSVRAWGVKNEDIMKELCGFGVDGMTVDFPDKLAAFLSGDK